MSRPSTDVSTPVATGAELVGAGCGWNEEDLTPLPTSTRAEGNGFVPAGASTSSGSRAPAAIRSLSWRTARSPFASEADAALEALVASGLTQSQAMRLALVEAARRRAGDSSLAVEAARLAADESDRREIADVRAFMDELRAAW